MMNALLMKKHRMYFRLSLVALILVMIYSLLSGYEQFSLNRLFWTLIGQGTASDQFIVYSIRLPRTLVTLMCGMALALSGSLLQSITQNDLADPGLIGINAGAGVSVTIFYLFFDIQAGLFVYFIPLVGFLGAMLTAFLIYLLSSRPHQGVMPMHLILIGVGFGTGLSGLMIMLMSSQDASKVDFIAKWLAGNIWGSDWPFVFSLLPWLLLLIPLALVKANQLNLLTLSEPVSIGLGLSVKKERLTLLVVAVALAAASVAVAGSIAFIGLMAPHLAKRLIGPRHQLFLPLAILLGGLLLLLADIIGRSLLSQWIPAGIIVSIIGAPYFIYLLVRND